MAQFITNRRQFLHTAGGVTLLAVGAPLLQGCGSGQKVDRATSNSAVTLPTFQAREGGKPDLPALPNGAPAGYLSYPASPARLYDRAPAGGGSISLVKMVEVAVPPVNKNPFWQELNRRVGAELKMTNVIAADYISTKLNTVLAGGDLPDLIQLNRTVPRVEDLVARRFQNLSQWLAGDAVKNYPSLAALPTGAWREAVFNGGIYGIPIPMPAAGETTEIRTDLFAKKGLSADMSKATGQDFLAACKALTEPRQRHWAVDKIRTALTLVGEMVGAPNVWKVEGGKFTRAFETEEYKKTVDIVRQMWVGGYIFPDSLSPEVDSSQWLSNGTIAIQRQGASSWGQAYAGATDPGFQLGGFVPPKWDGGGQAPHYLRSPLWTFTALKSASPQRIEELLRVLDWLAAPFGSEEYLFQRWGIPGRDYTLKGSDPVSTSTGENECLVMDVPYIASAPDPVYSPGMTEVTKQQYEHFKQIMDATVPLPTLGLYSETQLSKGKAIDQAMNELATDIVVGRQQLSAWDAGVQKWRSGGGDKIRSEYEDSHAKFGPK